MIEIAQTLTALKSILDVVNNLKSLKETISGGAAASDLAKSLNGEIIELQRQVYAANESALATQATQSGLRKRISDLEAIIAGQESWAKEKVRYHLYDAGNSVMVYRLRKEYIKTSGPMHCICPKCYTQGQKSILQLTDLKVLYQLNCPICGEFASQMKPFRL